MGKGGVPRGGWGAEIWPWVPPSWSGCEVSPPLIWPWTPPSGEGVGVGGGVVWYFSQGPTICILPKLLRPTKGEGVYDGG